MNGPIKTKLKIPEHVKWSQMSMDVFASLWADFMRDVVSDVDYLLANTDLKVVVYTGQLDLVVNTLGTLNWVHSLQWPELKNFEIAKREQMSGDKVEAYREASGYVSVRPGAHMFWWLFYTNSGNNSNALPLVIWIHGGPGASATGDGNFNEFGPLDSGLKVRNTSWIKYANLLFIDNPVGTGFSYVDNSSLYAKNNDEIAKDLLTLIKEFYKKSPEFESTPLYIFGESYGGKMTVGFAKELHRAIQDKEIKATFKGIALGDSWISPIDSVSTWGQYLYTLSYIDRHQKSEIDAKAEEIRTALKNGEYEKASNKYAEMAAFCLTTDGNVSWHNILYGSPFKPLDVLMNGPIKTKLKIPEHIKWSQTSIDVINNLLSDFMRDVVSDVDYLLANTDLKVVVYTGQLDLICNTLGTLKWIHSLQWPDLKNWEIAKREQMAGGYVKTHKKFSFYWIIKAGHMVPADAGDTALAMLHKVIQS
ncbi:unnamed protein product [Medioppia subpectinata]|uniref:Carboxypeptidase n=1 Tax=Medioppia subpectinata TaxID=1979941 RepID=A0A7R9LBN6_9ACAR|nr:unnamed protein product [Medioppia subpectinata]CAG2117120.1 unnamed protein product [Medioppia subpectinata]